MASDFFPNVVIKFSTFWVEGSLHCFSVWSRLHLLPEGFPWHVCSILELTMGQSRFEGVSLILQYYRLFPLFLEFRGAFDPLGEGLSLLMQIFFVVLGEGVLA